MAVLSLKKAKLLFFLLNVCTLKVLRAICICFVNKNWRCLEEFRVAEHNQLKVPKGKWMGRFEN